MTGIRVWSTKLSVSTLGTESHRKATPLDIADIQGLVEAARDERYVAWTSVSMWVDVPGDDTKVRLSWLLPKAQFDAQNFTLGPIRQMPFPGGFLGIFRVFDLVSARFGAVTNIFYGAKKVTIVARKRRLAWDRSIQEAQQAEACKPGKDDFSQDQDSIARA
ncbi:hypothetical protein LA080_015374 [Diaporthe eres]|nr:hypothetical protein LA080_015374 [Diaporthe eres]